jgi:hypothetical protein
MPSLAELQMLDVSDLVWPVTYRWVVSHPTGFSSWEISVDAFNLNGHHDETVALGGRLFTASIATAICTSTRLEFFDYFIHKTMAAPSISGGAGLTGKLFGTPAPRRSSAALTFNTGHSDSYGRRQQYLYGMPNAWQDGAFLTNAGWDGVMGYAYLLAMGLQGQHFAGELQHLIPYWHVLPTSVPNFFGVAFRRVTSYNVFQYVEKAPELSTGLWPPTGS